MLLRHEHAETPIGGSPMSNNSSTRSGGFMASGASQSPPDPRLQSNARSQAAHNRRTVMIGAAALCILILGAIVGFATQFGLSARSTSSPQATTAWSNEVRSATIITDSVDDERCRQRTFDNKTGLWAETNRPCKGPAMLDSNGNPLPLGTMRRLDGISKSFSGH
jgi:hypothetical protein